MDLVADSLCFALLPGSFAAPGALKTRTNIKARYIKKITWSPPPKMVKAINFENFILNLNPYSLSLPNFLTFFSHLQSSLLSLAK